MTPDPEPQVDDAPSAPLAADRARPAPEEPVLNALELCNSCDIRRAEPSSPAGYCAVCEAEARGQTTS